MLHGRCLRAGHQLREQLALFCHAVGIGQFARRFDRLDSGFGRIEAANLAAALLPEFVKYSRVLDAILIGCTFGRAWGRLANLLAGKGYRIVGQTVFADDLVD